MFYTGWRFTAPSSMDVSALAADMRQTHAAGKSAAGPVVTQQLLSTSSRRHRPRDERASAGEAEAAAPRHSRQGPAGASSTAKPRSHSQAAHAVAGSVLRLAPRQALTYREMEQQLQRRATGASDCFHVKSNRPILAQSGVVMMECVVGPAATAAAAAAAFSGEKTAAGQPTSPARQPLPALVIGVCQRHLPWYNLPGEGTNSIGFYVTQRHVMKHVGEDQDEVIVPAEGCAGAGNRIGEGDHVGCLVDMIQHTLSFTVNDRIVSTHTTNASCEDGSLYFAIGLARRPQQATDVLVRFFSGSAATAGEDAESYRSTSGGGGAAAAPRFPFAQYVRALAIQSVRGHSLRGTPSAVTAAVSDTQDVVSALKSRAGNYTAEQQPQQQRREAGKTAKAAAAAAVAAETGNGRAATLSAAAACDARTAAVLREYLAQRGLAHTLAALNAELDTIVPSYARLCAAAPEKSSEGVVVAETSQCASRVLRPPGRGESRAAWQAHAAAMARLRQAVLFPGSHPDTEQKTASAAVATPSQMLMTHSLWKPTLTLAFAQSVAQEEEEAEGTSEAEAVVLQAPLQERSPPLARQRTAATRVTPTKPSGSRHATPTRDDDAAKASRKPLTSPYEWFAQALSPSFLALAFLGIRQDVRYLLHAHHAVEEMWRLLQRHVQTAKDACRTAAAAADNMAGAQATPFAVSMEDEQREMTAFAAFVASVLGGGDGLPSPHTGLSSRGSTRQSRDQEKHAVGDRDEQSEHVPRPPPVDTEAVEVLAALAGHTRGGLTTAALTRAAAHKQQQQQQRDALSFSLDADGRHFYALITHHLQHQQQQQQHSSKEKERPPASLTPLEEAVLVLHRHAVVPAVAPSLSTQARLQQTLCSLLAHTLSTLRQLSGILVHPPRGEVTNSSGSDRRLRSVAAARDDRAAGVSAVLAAADHLESLLCAVRQRCRLLVWRRLVHAMESVNGQLEATLRVWSTARQRLRVTSVSAAWRAEKSGKGVWATRRRREPIDESFEEREADAQGNVKKAEEEEEEEGRAGAESESLTASFSSFQAAPASQGENEGECGKGTLATTAGAHSSTNGGGNGRADIWSRNATSTTAESLAESLPSLRLLWRRVAARAALQPSQHLVTDLFVEELRRSLLLAPPLGWRNDRQAGGGAASSVRGASASPAQPAPEAPLSVKRPLHGASGAQAEDEEARGAGAGDVPNMEVDAAATAALAADTRRFTEELYLSSVYMKRVLKHLSGV